MPDGKDRHLVLVSHPRVDHGKMLLMLCIKDWDQYQCFYYPLEKVDNLQTQCHILWKMSSSLPTEVLASAEVNITERDPEKLVLTHWRYE